MTDTNRLTEVVLDDGGLPPPTPEIEQERQVALFDLMEQNQFRVCRDDATGPYKLTLGILDKRLVFNIHTHDGQTAAEFHLSLTPMRQVVRDYFQICESYFDAVKRLPPSQIEAIDMARRGIHNEGARTLIERLDGKVEIDTETARRLFTLICVLQAKG